jgi:prepilin-type N-terminal cleavage/methylation domain-containing protein
MTTVICKNTASRELVGLATTRIVMRMSHSQSSSTSSRRTSGYSVLVSPRRVMDRRAGYTLIEMMIVVAITGVLAAVAIPAFTGWIRRSRTSEAAAFLGIIKLRQASYRGEFGQYAGFLSDVGSLRFVPGDHTIMRGGGKMSFPVAAGVLGPPTPESPFFAIGAQPDGQVAFGYGIVAGTPAQSAGAAGGTDIAGAPYNVPPAELDFYFIAQATTDLDDNGTALIMECTSFGKDIWSSAGPKGWD